ncbi:hypothetical protein FPOA_12867 [Fusarium poae]|uniref:Uncharacterized protein n=1 Tax=Fusarium poae TaxID=36050 RepID=A0A1B8A7R5_FUSPO|nr:hypothetical protein FPOA_12867 [Fusarium poae]
MLSEIGRHAPELDGPDISHLLPPPTPPLELYLPGGSPLGSDEVPGVPLLVSGHSEGDTENLPLMAAVDTMETSPPADADHEYRMKRLGRQLVQQSSTIRPKGHIGLAAYLESTADVCPEVLSSTRIAFLEDDLSGKMSSSDRRRVYCGLGSGGQAPHICLNEDERITHVAGVSFDVESVTGFPSNLSIAKQGIRWSPTQMPVSDLQSDLHLCRDTLAIHSTSTVHVSTAWKWMVRASISIHSMELAVT